MKEYNFSTARLRFYFFLIAFIIGLAHTWLVRYIIEPDGISYLDIGDAYFHGDWKLAINAFWSPLYSWMLGFFLHIFKPDSYWESTFIHFINFVIYLIAFFCFDFFLLQFLKSQKQKETKLLWTWLIFGYTLFIWSSINLVTISSVTPDMCVSAIVYLISGILLKIKLGIKSYLMFFLLGIILGLGYLTKAIMFPLAFLYIFMCFFLVDNMKIALLRIPIALLAFLLVSSPYIFVISKLKGHFTFSESPILNYAWNIDQSTNGCCEDVISACGKLSHPTRKIFNEPKAYEFSSPIITTDPIWHDPSYWYDGLKPHFTLKGQLKALKRTAKEYFYLFFHLQKILIIAWLILFLFSLKDWSFLKDISKQWIFFIPSIAVMAAYSLVHVEGRYIGPFVVLFWLALFSVLKFKASKETTKIISSIVTILVVFILITSLISKDFLQNWKSRSVNKYWQVAYGLKKIGFQEGNKIAVIVGENNLYWARLAKMHVIAEVPYEETSNFWNANDEVKLQVFKAFKQAGAKFVIAEKVENYISKIDWKNIKGTSYYFYVL